MPRPRHFSQFRRLGENCDIVAFMRTFGPLEASTELRFSRHSVGAAETVGRAIGGEVTGTAPHPRHAPSSALANASRLVEDELRSSLSLGWRIGCRSVRRPRLYVYPQWRRRQETQDMGRPKKNRANLRQQWKKRPLRDGAVRPRAGKRPRELDEIEKMTAVCELFCSGMPARAASRIRDQSSAAVNSIYGRRALRGRIGRYGRAW